MSQELQNKVESFLSKAEIVLFINVDKEIIMGLNFAKEQYDVFKDVSNYENMNAYFEGRNITLRIVQQPTYYRGSLIDTENGDAINLNNVMFVTENLDQFVNGVPTDVNMPLFIYGFKKEKDGTIIRIMQPILPKSKPLIVHGYSYIYNE